MNFKFYVIGRERRRARAADVPQVEDRRAPKSDACRYIALPDRRVSRRHAELYILGDRIFLRDLGSKNGTFVVKGKKVVRLTEGYVEPDQIVSFGGSLQQVSKLIDGAGGNGPRRNNHKRSTP